MKNTQAQIFLTVMLALCLLFTPNLIAQKSDNLDLEKTHPTLFNERQKCWGSAGLGISTYGLVLNAHIAFQQDVHLFTANMNYNMDFGFSSEYAPDNILEFSFLYGRTFDKLDLFLMSYSAGLGYIKSDKYIGESYTPEGVKYHKREVHSTVGLTVQGEIFFPIYDNIGYGFTGFVNLNTLQPYTGITMSIYVGKFQ